MNTSNIIRKNKSISPGSSIGTGIGTINLKLMVDLSICIPASETIIGKYRSVTNTEGFVSLNGTDLTLFDKSRKIVHTEDVGDRIFRRIESSKIYRKISGESPATIQDRIVKLLEDTPTKHIDNSTKKFISEIREVLDKHYNTK